ncbi:MAG: methyltransferase domain-containing protein [Planctomycetota bacterium]
MKHFATILLLLLGACQGPELSVRPGINDPFLGAEVDVDDFAMKWEGESREVYVNRAAIVDAMNLEPGSTVADVGAGTGAFLEELARAVGPSGRVLALDIAPEFVARLAERAEREDLPQVEARLCSERSLDLPRNSIDVAFACDVYHHFEYPRSSVGSIARALRPGGEFILVDFERIPGVSRPWILDHVRAGKEQVFGELESFGFTLVEEIELPGLVENWMARFRLEP